MGKVCWKRQIFAGVLAVGTAATARAAAPSPADILRFQPKQHGVMVTTPSDAELSSCKVELVSGPGAASGWMLKDAKGLPIRKFVATKGAKAAIDVWSYYLDGQEVYREMDTAGKNRPDQFRWYGPAGMRWGVDVNGDLRIDGWKQISAEEVSQELLKAIITKDAGRFQALLINDAEIKALELPQADADRYRQSVQQAPAKFTQMVQTLSALNEKTQWVHLEASAPQCIPADQTGGKTDLVHYKNATLLYENAGKHDWITIGEIVQFGRAWRLVSAPTPGNTSTEDTPAATGGIAAGTLPGNLQNELQAVDKTAPAAAAPPAATAKFGMDRAAVLEKIIAAVPPADREQWVKQLADSYSTAAQSGNASDKAPVTKLTALKDKIVREQPNSNVAAYVVYREMTADYAAKTSVNLKPGEFEKAQEAWRDKLSKFIESYPTCEDAPEAAMQAGMVSEFLGKESDAKTWYAKLAKDYAQSPQGPKAEGALRRLGLEGQTLELEGPTLSGSQFNIAQLRGKVVVVYYWASWNNQCAADCSKLQDMAKKYAEKGVAVITVNLDNAPSQAAAFLQQNQLSAPHLFMPGGLESPLATKYGVMVLPNIFIVGKDGKVANRTVQISGLEDEVKKLTEK